MIPENSEAIPRLRRYTAKILGRFGIDQAVRWTLLTQCIRFITGPITMVLMLKFLTPEVQGYAYTFGSVLGLSVFLEMGFSQNILQFASHEFSKLGFDPKRRLEGDPTAHSRLVSLGRLSFKYYGIASVVFLGILLIVGNWFFATPQHVAISWEIPWILACVSSALALAFSPCWALLEGCNQIAEIERFRFYSALMLFTLTAIAMIAGWGLYAFVIPPLVGAFVNLSYLVIRWRKFFGAFTSPPSGSTISWKEEIWPFQWRIAISWASGYFIFSLITPIIFRTAGAAAAGRFGFTMQLIRMIAAISNSWTTTKLPTFGILVARKNWAELNSLWRKVTATSLIVASLGSVCLILGMEILPHFYPEISGRYAGGVVAFILCICMMLQLFTGSCAYYLRAFKVEPYMHISILNAVLSAVAIPLGASVWGLPGATAGYAIAIFTVAIPAYYIFIRKRAEYTNLEAGDCPI